MSFSKGLAQTFGALAVLSAIFVYIKDIQYRRVVRFDYVYLFIILYVGWSILAGILGSDPGRSFKILRDEWLFLIIPCMAVILSGESRLGKVVRMLALSSIVISLYAVWQHFSGMDIYRGIDLYPAPTTGYRAVGFFANAMTFGNFFVIAALFFLGAGSCIDGLKNKVLMYMAFFLSAASGLLSYGRGPLIALAAGLVVYLVLVGRKYYKTALPVLAGLLICIYVFAPDILSRHFNEIETELRGTYAGSRFAIWRSAGRMIEDNPVLGVGPGNIGKAYPDYRDPGSNRVYTHVHNDLLNIACHAGIPAVLLYLAMWAAVFWHIKRFLADKAIRPMPKSITVGVLLASVVFLATSLYEASFDDLEIRILLMGLWGLFYSAVSGVKMRSETADQIEMT